jgi:hypothetical protein
MFEGRLLPSGEDDGWVTRFHPKGIRFLTLIKSVSLSDGQLFFTCDDCGQAWSKIDAQYLRELLQKSGDEGTLSKPASSNGRGTTSTTRS